MSRSDQISVPQTARESRAFGLPGTLAQWWNALAVGACGLTVLVLGYQRRWTNDDALIYTRAVRQILAGNGPVYNIGERAETSTGTLWQWMLATGSAIPGVTDPLRLAVALGLLLTVAGYLLALDGTRRMVRTRRPAGALLPVGVLLLLPLAATWDYATSGLETGLSFAWLGGSWWLLVRARAALGRAAVPRASGPALPLAAAFVFGLGPLVRPDLALVSGVFLVAMWLMWRPSLRRTLSWACAAGVLPVAYEIFRAGYYGVLVPLPALAKEASGTQWEYGFNYLLNTLVPYCLWIPLTLLAAFAVRVLVLRRRRDPRRERSRRGPADRADALLVAAPVVAGLLSAFFVVKIGGDFMHGRMVLPALFLGMLPVFLMPYRRPVAVLAGTVGVWAVVCVALLRPPLDSPDSRLVFDSRTLYARGLGEHPVSQSAHTERHSGFPDAVRGTRRAGKHGLVLRLPYDAGFPVVPLAPRVRAPIAGAEARLGSAGAVLPLDGRVVDLLGLGNPLGAHTEPTSHRKAGHEKPLHRAWVLADLTAPGTPVPEGVEPRHVAAARHALTCGPVPELLASTRAPLTASRFLDNLTGAWSRTQLRIPAHPVRAERELCG
ncbi:hypothetical protein [Streptomyces iconiensis]|uniref:Terminal beta-(1->2)-arabinofuranosyltransferase C-terminal domain-containing protein n=1 Tax=Streptomyces iconiensis TaxID=1384038 RepID=A0ABT7A990_9ACTN|nr:hypothetical protein [Streptomyces iconiensis]MDJ1137607.1 hypothetical protein [Streptomyces iconiensis]